MKTHKIKFVLVGAFLLAGSESTLHAQQFSVGWYKVAGGGGISAGTNGSSVYSVSGTIGQHDAGGPMTAGSFSLTGGYWSLIAPAQTPGAPLLSISAANGSVTASWPAPSTGYHLQTNSILVNTNNWVNYTGTITLNSAGTSNSVTITPPLGNLFFRLGP